MADEFSTEWFGDSKVVDKTGEPLVLYRGLSGSSTEGFPDAALAGEPRSGYATFLSDNPKVAGSYADISGQFGSSGAIVPFYVKADEVIEFHNTRENEHGHFDMFEFDRQAKNLRPGQVLVARNVRDSGPHASLEADPDYGWQARSDTYAIGPGTQMRSAISEETTQELRPTEQATVPETSSERLIKLRQAAGDIPLPEEVASAEPPPTTPLAPRPNLPAVVDPEQARSGRGIGSFVGALGKRFPLVQAARQGWKLLPPETQADARNLFSSMNEPDPFGLELGLPEEEIVAKIDEFGEGAWGWLERQFGAGEKEPTGIATLDQDTSPATDYLSKMNSCLKGGYNNCKSAVQQTLNNPELTGNRIKVSEDDPIFADWFDKNSTGELEKNLSPGDVLDFNQRHYAIYEGPDTVVQVPEWGATPERVSLSSVLEYWDPPTQIIKAAYEPQPTDRAGAEGSLRDTAFEKLAYLQRGDPELAMLDVQNAYGGGVYSVLVEHVGDITHRMSEMPGYLEGGLDSVAPKVRRALNVLRSEYTPQREYDESLRNNAQYNNVALEDRAASVDKARENYTEQHRKLPVYNEMQRNARDAAIAIGEQRWADAQSNLEYIEQFLDDPKAYKAEAMKYNPSYQDEGGMAQGGLVNAPLSVNPDVLEYGMYRTPFDMRRAIAAQRFAEGGIASLPKSPVLGGQQHMLAYITPEEASTLRAQGGGVTPDGGQYTGPGGIASFVVGGEGATSSPPSGQAQSSTPGNVGTGSTSTGNSDGDGGGKPSHFDVDAKAKMNKFSKLSNSQINSIFGKYSANALGLHGDVFSKADIANMTPAEFSALSSNPATSVIGDPNSVFGQAVTGLVPGLLSLAVPALSLPLGLMGLAMNAAGVKGMASLAGDAFGYASDSIFGEAPSETSVASHAETPDSDSTVGQVSDAISNAYGFVSDAVSDAYGYAGDAVSDAAFSAAQSLGLADADGNVAQASPFSVTPGNMGAELEPMEINALVPTTYPIDNIGPLGTVTPEPSTGISYTIDELKNLGIGQIPSTTSIFAQGGLVDKPLYSRN